MKLNEQIDFSSITKKTWTREQFFKIFCGIMLGGIFIFLLSLLCLGVDRWRYLFFILTDPSDSFMDFFNPIAWAGVVDLKDAYLNSLNIYPPLVVLFTGIFGSYFQVFQNTMRGGQFLNYPLPLVCLSTFLVVSISSLYLLLFINKTGDKKTKLLFCLFMFFSAPFLFWFERGNYIILAVIFSLLFIMFYDSNKKYLRYLALFALALAINIKIYPAVLGLLLLKEKKFKEIFLLGIYTALLFFVPLIFLGGIKGILLCVNNLQYITEQYLHRGYGYLLSFSSTTKMLVYAVFRTEYPILNKIFFIISGVCLIVGSISAYRIESKWKTLAILCLLMILIPQISFTYALLFMMIPLMYFLNDRIEKNFKDLIYLILFCLIFILSIPMEMPIFMPLGFAVLIDNFLSRLACVVMFIMLCYDGLRSVNYGK